MHAVLESALEENTDDGMQEAQKVRNHALIHYLASLANSNNNDDIFDFDFVESLITNGADVNSTDKNGQTIFHEVARSWNLDVALFLLENGKHRKFLNKARKWRIFQKRIALGRFFKLA
jgi:ankyrin repeat protein